jgi:hypothetical protein
MSTRGMSSAPYDTVKFIATFLNMLNVIDDAEMTTVLKSQGFKGKQLALLDLVKKKGKEIVAAGSEIVDKMPEELENYINRSSINRGRGDEKSGGAGRVAKYAQQAADKAEKKEAVAKLKQQKQIIKHMAASQTGDSKAALQVIDTGLDKAEQGLVSLGAGIKGAEGVELDFDDIDINVGAIKDRDALVQKLISFFNKQNKGFTAEVTPRGLNVEGPKGIFGTNASKINDVIVGLVKKSRPDIDEKQIVVDLHADRVESEDAEDVESFYNPGVDSEQEYDEVRGADLEGIYDELNSIMSSPDYYMEPNENGNWKWHNPALHDRYKQLVKQAIELSGGNEPAHRVDPQLHSDYSDFHKTKHGFRDRSAISYNDMVKWLKRHGIKVEDEEFSATKADINKNGKVDSWEKRIAKKRGFKHTPSEDEETIAESYTSMYLTEQVKKDSVTHVNKDGSVPFKEKYRPKTSYQLDELRRYGL